jgi:flagellum-specific peptidoglycan hydrolase FlgJ
MQVSRPGTPRIQSAVANTSAPAKAALPPTPAPAAPTPPADQSTLSAAQGQAQPALALFETPDPGLEALKQLTPKQLAELGKQADKGPFFKALLPGALESQRKYGIPAQLTLAQAALESGWGKHAIGGYNIFGIKGAGPAGSVVKSTREYTNTQIKAAFAKFHNFHEAISEHGQVFHNGAYDKALAQFKKDNSVSQFVRNIGPVYATAPNYAREVLAMITKYGLNELVNPPRAQE